MKKCLSHFEFDVTLFKLKSYTIKRPYLVVKYDSIPFVFSPCVGKHHDYLDLPNQLVTYLCTLDLN